MEIDPNHPGLTVEGVPGSLRYFCAFCDWFFDDPPYDTDHYLPTGFEWNRYFSFEENIARMVRDQMELRDALVEHVIEDHLRTHVQEMTDD